MTRLAKRKPICYIIPKLLVVLPRLYVMGLDTAVPAAMLAGKVVAPEDGLFPPLVFVGVSLLVRVAFALGCVAALLAAIFGFKMAVGRTKFLLAPPTGKHRPLPVSLGGQLGCAGARAGGLKWSGHCPSSEWLVANLANGVATAKAKALAYIGRFEGLVAKVAIDGPEYLWKSAIATRDVLGHAGEVFRHAPSVALVRTFCNLERWSVATEKTPVLLGTLTEGVWAAAS